MTTPVTDAPAHPDQLSSVLRWSIADAWAWFGHAWRTFIHEPYLGLITLVLVLSLVLRAVGKTLR